MDNIRQIFSLFRNTLIYGKKFSRTGDESEITRKTEEKVDNIRQIFPLFCNTLIYGKKFSRTGDESEITRKTEEKVDNIRQIFPYGRQGENSEKIDKKSI